MKITVELTDHQAIALAQMCKRIGWSQIQELSNQFDKYSDGLAEADHMLDGISSLRRALAEKGYAPR